MITKFSHLILIDITPYVAIRVFVSSFLENAKDPALLLYMFSANFEAKKQLVPFVFGMLRPRIEHENLNTRSGRSTNCVINLPLGIRVVFYVLFIFFTKIPRIPLKPPSP